MKDSAKEERASIRRVHALIDWLCDETLTSTKKQRRQATSYAPARKTKSRARKREEI
jgi:hypothetical protein